MILYNYKPLFCRQSNFDYTDKQKAPPKSIIYMEQAEQHLEV